MKFCHGPRFRWTSVSRVVVCASLAVAIACDSTTGPRAEGIELPALGSVVIRTDGVPGMEDLHPGRAALVFDLDGAVGERLGVSTAEFANGVHFRLQLPGPPSVGRVAVGPAPSLPGIDTDGSIDLGGYVDALSTTPFMTLRVDGGEEAYGVYHSIDGIAEIVSVTLPQYPSTATGSIAGRVRGRMAGTTYTRPADGGIATDTIDVEAAFHVEILPRAVGHGQLTMTGDAGAMDRRRVEGFGFEADGRITASLYSSIIADEFRSVLVWLGMESPAPGIGALDAAPPGDPWDTGASGNYVVARVRRYAGVPFLTDYASTGGTLEVERYVAPAPGRYGEISGRVAVELDAYVTGEKVGSTTAEMPFRLPIPPE